MDHEREITMDDENWPDCNLVWKSISQYVQQLNTLEHLASNLDKDTYTVSDRARCLELFKCPKYDNC